MARFSELGPCALNLVPSTQHPAALNLTRHRTSGLQRVRPETLLGEIGPRLHGQVGSNGGKEEGRPWAAMVLRVLLSCYTLRTSGNNHVLAMTLMLVVMVGISEPQVLVLKTLSSTPEKTSEPNKISTPPTPPHHKPLNPKPETPSGHGRCDQRRRLTLLLDREAQSGGSHEAEPWPQRPQKVPERRMLPVYS